jgi:hypothetical protein
MLDILRFLVLRNDLRSFTACVPNTAHTYECYRSTTLQGFETLRQLAPLLNLGVTQRGGGRGNRGICECLTPLLLFTLPYLVPEAL